MIAEPSVAAQVAALQTMSVPQLRLKWLEIMGEPTRQRHRRCMIKRLAAAIQGDTGPQLTAEEEAKVTEYRAMLRQMPPEKWFPVKQRRPKRPRPARKRRTLTPGTVVTRQYEGQEIVVKVLEGGGFEYAGNVFRSLSAIAREITGTTWSGPRWFGLNQEGRS